MIRRLLGICIGAVLVCTMAARAVVAKPPDLPENGTFTAAPRTPQPVVDDDVLNDAPPPELGKWFAQGSQTVQLSPSQFGDWFSWLVAHWTARHQPPAPEQNEGFVRRIATGVDFAYRAVQDMPRSDDTSEVTRISSGYDAPVSFNFDDEVSEDRDSVQQPATSGTGSSAPNIEILPMPHEEADITCPYLRQQTINRHACQIADPEIGRDVLANLESLKEADNLVELAKEMARYGFLTEAMMCCDLAATKCPGSRCAERAIDTLSELASGSIPPTTDAEESAEPQPDEPTEPPSPDAEPGVEPMVFDLMKACHLLMSQGMQHQAAELARQAFALDPQRVMADPLVYKMHLLAESPPTPAGASEESEPPTCPYCPSIGKPIREILPEKTKSKDGPTTFLVPSLPPIDYEVVPALDGELLLSADCSLGDNVYHLRYKHGSLSVWTTTDASKTNP